MKQQDFERANEAAWERFEALALRLESQGRGPFGRARDPGFEIFPGLYRNLCRDLAIASQRRYSPALIERLNALALGGHRHLYSRDIDLRSRVVEFALGGFAARVRRDWRYVAIAVLLFVGPAAVVGALIAASPEFVYSALDSANIRSLEAMYDPANERFGSERQAETDIQMFGFYIMNNIGIAFRTFASGIFLGVGSIIILVLNGLLIGAASAHMVEVGFERTFFPFVVGHGSFELIAIVLAGAAGLKLGWGIIAPGALSRRASLRRQAAEAVEIIYGVLAMLVVAALIEAFWSSKQAIPIGVKLAVGGAGWVAVLGYFAIAGRGRARERAA